MKTYTASAASRGGALLLLATLAAVASPADAACNATPKARIDPLSQTIAETTGGVATGVGLNGSGSTPNAGLLYAWVQTAGTAVTLSGATTATASFPAPNVGPSGATLTFRLTVTCGPKQDSTTTTINITDVVTNNPPTAAATASPSTAYEGNLVTLDGTGSYDIDPGTTLSYAWAQTGGSPTVTLSNANPAGSIVTFTAPNTPINTGATLTFRLTVSDGSLTGSTDKIVNVVWTNDPPVASLVCPGGVFVVDEGDPVTLNGSGSSDSDGSIVSHAWDQIAGLPNLGIGALTTSSINFNAPSLGYNQLGSITLRLTVTDDIGAASSAECGVFINDVTAPVISVPADIIAEADSPAGKAVNYTVLAQDAVDDASEYSLACVPPSGSDFPLAAAPSQQNTTPVACEAMDAAGNTANAGFDITVQDTTAPTITVPGSFAVEATGSGGAIANYSATTGDAVDGPGSASCVPVSGSTFVLGTTLVTCNATDARGNVAAAASFNLTVHDTTDPVVTPPANVTVEATGPLTVVAHGIATASDAVGVVSLSNDAPASFPVGATTITWTALDAAGNSGSATSTVTVQDTTPPTIAAHGDLLEEATGPAGAIVSYASPGTSDLVDGPGTASCTPASGGTFGLGPTTVNCDATDNAGNPASQTSFTVTVVDTTPPTIDPHADITGVEATGPGGAAVPYVSPATDDLVDGTGAASCLPASGSTFALGSSTVTCSASDAAGNAAVATTFTVAVVDTTPPVIDVHAAIGPVEATGPGGASVAYTSPATSDIVDGAGTASCLAASASTFPLGLSTVHCNASDNAGNAASETTFTIWVVDTTPPVIAVHGGVGPIEATGPTGAPVSYTSPSTSDAVDGTGTATCLPGPGSTFALGASTVICNAEDAAGNDATTTTFDVTVVDTTPPTIDAHAAISGVEATGPGGAPVNYTSPATLDLVDGNGTADCTPVSGSTFALGTSTVTCTATDFAGNGATATTFDITVVDTKPPTIDAHDPIGPIEATGPGGAAVSYTSPATADIVDGAGTATCLPVSGSTFGLGINTVTCNASDDTGNAATPTTFTVWVVDKTPPVIAAHADVGPIEATSAAGAVIGYASPATSDIVDGAGTATCLPASGSTFALGSTTVTCNATDNAGNAAASTSFTVTVHDTTAPGIAPHADVIAEATGPGGASVSYTSPATTDLVDAPGTATCAPASGSTFALGGTTVTCNAQDAAGNNATPTTFTVTVVDTTAPVIAAHADVNATATSNSSAVVNYTPLPTASDLVDGAVTVTCTPAPGSTFNVGSTTVNCSATDNAGNTGHSSFAVIVSYGFTGFFRPIDNLPVKNVVKAGSAIPVKFSLGGNQGLNIFAAGYPSSGSVACDASPTDVVEETVTAGGSSLTYDAATGQYIYVWKTEKSWTGCRLLQVKLRDGTSRWALFSFTR